MTERKKIKTSRRIVFKLGTNIITNQAGNIALARIYSLIESIAELKSQNKEIILVTSGAVGMGAKILGNSKNCDPVSLKQAHAAVGQGQLMHFYEEAFEKFNIITAQILLTAEDFSVRKKYLSLRNTLNTLLELGVVPIINENDAISTSELEGYKENGVTVCFGDNDKLSALVASKLDADILVILSDVDGLYTGNPKTNKDSKLISIVKDITPEIESYGQDASKGGRGGMKTKIEAAKIVAHSGSMVVVAGGQDPDIIRKIFRGEEVGTLFLPVEHLSGRKKWIAFATNIGSSIKVNEGAKKALIDKKASLMPIGIIEIKNSFKKGDVISILDEGGREFARGMTNYSSTECKKVIGKNSEEIERILGFKNYDTVVTRDNIVVL
ncbi:MAG: glutamate 5-kinase [Candidatus Melainabacteria bacterium GWF2_37_15]|nr:MAG: glutamate 5-kinase [Candidatus Melainabacteria bacterium GWF2_37_15]